MVEPFPEIQFEFTTMGLDQARVEGNQCFQNGRLEQSLKWFSKGIWLAKQLREAPRQARSTLYSNRAFIQLRLQNWAEAEADCTEALSWNNAEVLHDTSLVRLDLQWPTYKNISKNS